MRFYKIFGIIQRILINFFRDYKLMLITFLAPLIILLVFSITYKPDINDIKIGIIDLDIQNSSQLNISASLSQILKEYNKKISIIQYKNLEDAKKDFKNNKVDSIIVFPENLNETVYIKLSGVPVEKPAEVFLYVDESDKVKSSIISESLESSINKFSQSFGIEPAFMLKKDSFYKKADSQDFWNAAIIGFSIFVLSLIFSISLISNEKLNGLYESIISTHMTNFEILTGYFIGYLIINILQIIILLSIYIIFFKAIFSLSILYIFLFMFLLSLSGTLLGIFLGNLTSSTIRSFQIAVIIILISLLISGIFWATSSLPLSGKILSYLFPTSFAIEAIRGITIKQMSFVQLFPNFLILLVFSIIYYLIAAIFIRKTID